MGWWMYACACKMTEPVKNSHFDSVLNIPGQVNQVIRCDIHDLLTKNNKNASTKLTVGFNWLNGILHQRFTGEWCI